MRGNRVSQRKDKKPSINQQPLTSLVDEPDVDNSVTHAKGTANASSDSGYVSTTRVEADTSERKSPSEQHKVAKSGAQAEINVTTRENPSSTNELTSTKERPKVFLVAKQQEDDEVADSQEESSDQEEAKGGPVDENDYMHDIFGSSIDEDEEQVAPEEYDLFIYLHFKISYFNRPPQTPSNTPSVERMYPDLQNAPDPDIQNKESHIPGSFNPQRPLNPSQEPTPPQSEPSRHPPTSPQVVHPPVLVPTRPVKKVLKRKIPDEDPFLDNIPASPANRSPVTKGHPPVLKEGPYRNSYVFAQPTAEAVWPPERKRKTFELANEKLSTDAPLASVAPTEHNQPTAPMQQPHQRRRQRVKQRPNAVASSSKVKLPATAVQPDGPLPNTSAKLPPSSKTEQANKRQKTENYSNTSNHHSHRDVATPSPSDSGAIVDKNPVVNTTSLPRIDLRESLQNRLLSLSSTSRRGSISSSRASVSASHLSSVSRYVRRRESAASTSSRHRRPSVISEKDIILFSLFKREMEKLGSEYGFSGDIVLNTYAETGSMENTRAVLTHMNMSMRAAQQGIYEARPDLFKHCAHESDNDDDSFPEGVIPLQSSPGQKQRGKTKRKSSVGKDMALGQKIRSSSARYARPSLNYKPLSGDEQDALSDYSPPSRTRARRYSKLQKEGREEEALAVAFGDSPIRRRSDGFFLHNKSEGQEISGDGATDREVRPQVTMIRRGMEPSSPLETQSSPLMGEDAMSVDGNEISESSVPADHEVPFQHGDAEDYGGAEADESDVFSDKRQSTRKIAPDEDAAQLARMEEHKRISSEVTIDNQDEMRAFEQKNDPDLLRRWSANWIRERVTSIREAQERRREHDRITTAEKARQSKEIYGLVADESWE
jgi:hypothetical protein